MCVYVYIYIFIERERERERARERSLVGGGWGGWSSRMPDALGGQGGSSQPVS